jgi:hypothetical protein
LANPDKANNNAFMQHKHRHHKKDIAERAMDEEVHDFAADNVPGTAWDRRDTSYGDNGLMNMYAQHRHQKKGVNPFIAERNMDEEVHGFVSDAINNPLAPTRNDEPYPMNGYKNMYPDVDHSQSGQSYTADPYANPDYNEKEAASAYNTAVPYDTADPNANHNIVFGQRKHRKHHRDIAERKMDEEVHGFVKSALPPLSERVRNEVPYKGNGW